MDIETLTASFAIPRNPTDKYADTPAGSPFHSETQLPKIGDRTGSASIKSYRSLAMLHRGLLALHRPGRGAALGRACWASSRSASSLRDRLLPKLPKGYWLPTIAVGCFTIVSSGALFDLAIRWISRREEDSDEWVEDWDEQLLEDGGFPEDIAAALAAGRGLRQSYDHVGTRHVFFVRHAQPGDGEPLTSLGIRQAEATAQRLQSQIVNLKRKVIFHSPAPEAKATADIIQKTLGKVRTKESPLLAEGIPVVPSPAPEQLQEIPHEVLASDGARAEGALRTHVWRPAGGPDASAEVVIGHGNLIRYLVCRALQLSPLVWSRFAAGHSTISWIEIRSDGAVLLREFGSAGHLPQELQSYR
eukprot:s7_g18.t1